MPIGVLLSASVLITVLGDFFAKYWSTAPSKTSLYYLAMGCWMLANVFFISSLLKKPLVTMGLMFTLANIVGFTLVGFFVFGESISTVQTIGTCVGFIALVLLGIN